ncbi:SPOR domain-containing protein [Acidiferrobacter sp.]|uniref:SPOR domain-containing protein n=1 Tax=Acidiferrobacter sp. TaxID=1872107 RepID=UPI002621F889|nr:SPOR domain-containing protein [Acidiferrobacter sp.]
MEEGSFDAKRRIVGAAILVTVAVVVLPILLRRPPSAVHGREILTVRRGAHGVQAVVADIPVVAATKGASTVANTAPTRPAPTARAGAQKPSSLPSRPTPMPPVSPARASLAPAIHASYVSYVQVGAYVNAADGIAFAHKLKEQGFPAHVKLARLASSRGVIVILGPYGKRGTQGVLEAIKQRDGIQGFVIQEAAR